MSGAGASPGGALLSSAKKRRLAALDKRSSAAPPARPSEVPAERRQGAPGGRAGDPGASASQPTKTSGRRPGAPAAARAAPAAAGRDPWHQPLPEDVASGPAAHAMGVRVAGLCPDSARSGAEGVAALLQGLLATNPRASDAQAIAGGRLKDRALLLENPVGKRGVAAVAARRRRNGRGPHLASGLATRRQQKAAGLYDLRSAGLKYSAVQPLHQRWQQYVQGLVAPSQGLREAQELLLGADLHGCLLRVIEAPAGSAWGGVTGIVVRDTKGGFQLVTPDDRLVQVPKAPCVFEYDVDSRRVVTLLGAGLVSQGSGQPQR